MNQPTIVRTRYIRLVVWALLMLATSLVVGRYAPRRIMFVPCAFIPLIVPMVLKPLTSKEKG